MFTLYLLTFEIAMLRILGEKGIFFQAIAHVFVGGLFVAGFKGNRKCLALAIILSVVETTCFIVGLMQ